jgi:hypothetical protein
MTDLPSDLADDEVIRSLAEGAPTTWIRPAEAALPELEDVMDSAAARFDRFAPWFAEAFPDTATRQPDTATSSPGPRMPGARSSRPWSRPRRPGSDSMGCSAPGCRAGCGSNAMMSFP